MSSLKQISQIFQSLIEMCVGNIENQQIVFDRLVMDPLNRMLQLSFSEQNNQDEEKVYKLIASKYVTYFFVV